MKELMVPCFCPLCQCPMKGKSTYTFYSSGVCVQCFIQFVEDREERWKNGWRPSKEEVDAYLARIY